MVFSPSAGADEALGPFVFRIINILSICQFLFYLFSSNDVNSFPHSNALATYVDLVAKIGQGHHRAMFYIYIVVL